jgi:hypothetical protein
MEDMTLDFLKTILKKKLLAQFVVSRTCIVYNNNLDYSNIEVSNVGKWN